MSGQGTEQYVVAGQGRAAFSGRTGQKEVAGKGSEQYVVVANGMGIM